MRATASSGLGWTLRKKTKKTGQSSLSKRRQAFRDALQVERLEDRLLLTATPTAGDNAWSLLPGDAGAGLDMQLAAPLSGAPLSSVPALHSNASATAKLYLDFDGHSEASWGSYSNITTPAFDQDGDPTTFSAGELSAINEIWARVSEDYAPFNIDVTTVDPGSQANKVVAVIAIGGSYSDWYNVSAGGVSYVGGFYNASPNVGYVFSTSLSGSAKYVAEASSHEAGHLFGLQHQAQWSGTSLINQYNPGSGDWAPIMGNSYSMSRTTWSNGPTPLAPTSYQDDLAIISGANNGFGYKADDYGNTIGAASSLPSSGTSVNFTGLIGQANDLDVWSFTTAGGAVSFSLTGAQYGSNLDGVLELWDSSGSTIVSNSPSNSYGASLSTTLGAGTYYLVAHSVGDYGDVGQYTITGTLPAAGPAPEIDLSVGGVALADGGTINFGSTTVGTAVTKTVTVTNSGTGVLSLTSLDSNALPSGFTLVSNLAATSLNPGDSTTFVVQLDATVAGAFSGVIHLASNDSNENPYDVTLSGTVTAPQIDIAISGVDLTSGQTVDFGSATVGQNVSRTFTVTNTGTATLVLTSLDPANLPAGFTLTTNLGSTSLAAGQSTTFTIEFDAATVGSFGGSIGLVNSDSNHNPFAIDLEATAVAAAPGKVTVLVAGQELSLGGLVDFGSTVTGSTLERTFWIRNDGGTVLTVPSLTSTTLPPGFSLYQDLTNTSLAPGEETAFILRLDAQSADSYSGLVSFASSDPSSPFTFQVEGAVCDPIAPVLRTLDDGDSGSTQSGAWARTTGKGYGSDIHTASAGGGGIVYSWSFGSLPAGQYQVWATWASATKNATNAPYSLFDGSSKRTTVGVNQRLAPSGLSANGASWRLLGTVTVNSGQLTVKLTNAANGKVVADAIRIQRVITVAAPVAAIGVTGAAGNLTSGSSTINFGICDVGQSQDRTFTITNHGNASLTLSPLDPANLPVGFSLVNNVGSTFLTPGESTTFTLRLDASAAGSFGGTISLANNDATKSPFHFQVSGAVFDPTAPLVRIIDDASAGNTRSGSWTHDSTKGYSGDQWTALAGSGSSSSTWNFTGLPNGQYRIQATWRAASTSATNAPYSLYNGAQLVTTVHANQRLAPSDVWDGAWWKTLGTVTVTGNQVMVKLTNAANGHVVADAIRIERIISGNDALPNNVLATLLASSPDAAPLPTDLPASSPVAPRTVEPNSFSMALQSGWNDLSAPLTDVVDLLAEDQHAPADQQQPPLHAAYGLALGSLLEQPC